MPIGNCPNCGKMFKRKPGRALCGGCKTTEDEMFLRVVEYVERNPDNDLSAIIQQTRVPLSMIKFWLRDGGLEMKNYSPDMPICRRCASPVETPGGLCPACLKEIQSDMLNLFPSRTAKEAYVGATMYTRRKKARVYP